ncbi:MAG: GNAT family N-acetyltransferase, partial [Oscillochloridaceae bacterium umkhey_bin13]
AFGDLVVPFKAHFVIDLAQHPETFVSDHHRRNIQRALNAVDVAVCDEPQLWLGAWNQLYANLIERHAIRGIARFSPESFAQQIATPGLVMFRATHQGEVVGLILWYCQGDVGYYHLAAYSEQGYALRSSFALFWYAITYFASQGLGWLSLGAGAGVGQPGNDGLTRFKQGWSTGTRMAYFCGRIFDQSRYRLLTESKGGAPSSYFPAYRRGEFG